jgi:chaperonin GroEL
VKKALCQPIKTIAANSGVDGGIVSGTCLDGLYPNGYDARGSKYCNLIEEGIIDPAKATRVAIESAASVAGMFLTTECAVVDQPKN